jgi:para-aminobenzoate synthetase/4-amino-4-deoxychorismate lyase
MRLPAPPFVLLDDARPGGAPSRLYADPVEVVEAHGADTIPGALSRLRAARGQGLHAAGFLAYGGERLWFGLFRGFSELDGEGVERLLPDPRGAWAAAPEPRISWHDYAAAFARVRDYIAAGDIYQANLSFRADVEYLGSEAALYALLRSRAAAGYGALIATGEQWLLSLSPELFFALDDDRLVARPMKGTALRGDNPIEDASIAKALGEEPKQRAENLMIVDLMRNDLARVAVAGSVAVPQLFEVEAYPTVHQMVSTVTAGLAPGRDALDVLDALFPCGSVTGAPKLRAMEVIAEVEQDSRGVYTGAIGRLDANGDAMFNVAIRTLVCDAPGRATLGLGSGVVADSDAESEWHECLAKGRFVTAGEQVLDLIETMRFDPIEGIALLERHLARMKASAVALGFEFDRHSARNELQAATFRLRVASRVRLLLGRSGALSIGIAPLPPVPAQPVRVAVRPLEVAPDDFRLRHKTSRRGFYDRARAAAGSWEVVFTDPAGFLTEGSFTSIFVAGADGTLLTPPLSGGLLPGVLRAELIESGRAREADLRPADLERGFFLGNALRGLVAAVTVAEPANADV